MQSPRHIAAHYLRTWFALDFVSSASSFIVYLTDAMGYKVLRNVRLLLFASDSFCVVFGGCDGIGLIGVEQGRHRRSDARTQALAPED